MNPTRPRRGEEPRSVAGDPVRDLIAWLLLTAAVLAGTVSARAAEPPPAAAPPSSLDAEMSSAPKPPASAADPALRAAFDREIQAAAANRRPVFEKYLPTLGAAAMLDSLERLYPACHGQSHDLGKAIFASTHDLGATLRECGSRCTSGCMHGAVQEAFGHESPEALVGKMEQLCREGEMARAYRPGNCAHALGHAFMLIENRDVAASLNACLYFQNEAMRYWCATGVFMEELSTGRPADDPRMSELHYPCDVYTQFPAACYRFKAPEMLVALGGSPEKLAAECRALPRMRRLGCFHGLGAAVINRVWSRPADLAALCASDSADDRAVCIEGAVVKIADFSRDRALAACASLAGADGDLCRDAVAGGIYRLDRPTEALYYDAATIGEKKPLAAPAVDPHAHHHHPDAAPSPPPPR